METTVSHATSEAGVRDTFGHIPIVPGDTFIKSTIANLSLPDQYLFQRLRMWLNKCNTDSPKTVDSHSVHCHAKS